VAESNINRVAAEIPQISAQIFSICGSDLLKLTSGSDCLNSEKLNFDYIRVKF